MRAAPPVHVDVPRSGAWLWFVTLLGGVSAAVACACLAQHAALPSPWLPGAAAFSIVAPMVWWCARVEGGTLAWDGQGWRWRGHDGKVRVAMDLGPVLLLRFEPADDSRRAWMSVSAAAAGAEWHGLRAAVYFRGLDVLNAHTQDDSAPRT